MEYTVYLIQTQLDIGHQNTVDFQSSSQQLNYFLSLPHYSTLVDTKADAFRTTMTLPVSLDMVQAYDYLIIRDVDKNYYYFITRKEMKTKGSTILELKCDVFQTYLFNYNIQESFVDRCHVPRWDKDGLPTNNNVDEGLEYGTTIVDYIDKVYDLPNNYIICATTPIGILQKGGGSDSGGSDDGGTGTNTDYKIIRYIKGWEGFGPNPYKDSGGVLTAGYGVTKINEPDYWAKLEPFPCSEKTATLVLIELIEKRYATPLRDKMQKDGIDTNSIKKHQFDAFLDLCYNAGLGGVTNSPMYKKFKTNPDDPHVIDGWENYYIRDNNGIVQPGLVSRRKDEAKMFSTGVYNNRAIQNLEGGYVKGDGYLPSNDTDSKQLKVVASARKLIGKPYVWGGNYPPLGDSRGTDCSGLMQWAYNDNGIKITRTTYTQIKQGREVAHEDVKPADLIFLRFQNGEPEHVFMYSGMKDGQHMCVEAPRTGLNIRERSFTFTSEMRIRRII